MNEHNLVTIKAQLKNAMVVTEANNCLIPNSIKNQLIEWQVPRQ